MNPDGPHADDMPNIAIPENGDLKIGGFNSWITLSGESAILDDDGFAIVIHANADDYTTDPGAGARIACGIISTAG